MLAAALPLTPAHPPPFGFFLGAVPAWDSTPAAAFALSRSSMICSRRLVSIHAQSERRGSRGPETPVGALPEAIEIGIRAPDLPHIGAERAVSSTR